MREIKFRYTWKRIKDGNLWQVIVPIECLEGKGDAPFLGNDLWKLIGRDQFTGLKDKNKTEIYEGDIVKFKTLDVTDESDKPTLEWIEKVEFREGSFMVNTFYLDRDNEIIGNIYENPELLKEKEQ